MKKILINYATRSFRKSQVLNSRTGKEVALVDRVISYLQRDIERDFYKKNKTILI